MYVQGGRGVVFPSL